MAELMECMTCGGKISSSVKVCPHCGEDGSIKVGFFAKLKKLIIYGVFGSVIFLFILGYTSNKGTAHTHKTHKKKSNTISPKLKKEFQSKMDNAVSKIRKEKKVIASTWNYNLFGDNISVVYAGVIDNKTDRSGYAQYLCIVLGEEGVLNKKYKKTIMVKVNDVKAMMNNGKNKILGEATCSNK